jgi:DNA modification methylase
MITLLQGDAREMLATLEAESVQTIVTSPPYFNLRRYTTDPREIGRESTLDAYIAALTEVFTSCYRVLRQDGTLWIVVGDTYANDSKWGGATGGKHAAGLHGADNGMRDRRHSGLPDGNLIGIPWRLAFALQDAGWVLRNEIIWHKPNAMPAGNAAKHRCGADHETVFLFAKQTNCYFDAQAIAEKALTPFRAPAKNRDQSAWPEGKRFNKSTTNGGSADGTRHPRTVWSISTAALSEEHYAPMPQVLAERCIRAGSAAGDTVLDPFAGSGTTGRAALVLQRNAVLIDLSYADMQDRRTDKLQVEMFV